MEEAFERKKLRYAELAAEAEQRGWRTQLCPLEVGCRATSTIRLMRDLAVGGQALCKAIKETLWVAEQSSQWLWLKRKDPNWSPK